MPPQLQPLPAPPANQLAAEEAVRQAEMQRKLTVEAALAAAHAAMAEKKKSKRKVDDYKTDDLKADESKTDDEDEGLQLSKTSKASAAASKNKGKAKVPKVSPKAEPSASKAPAAASKAAKPPAAASKASKGKKPKVVLTHTECRSYWLVRSSEGCKTFSYKHTSEKKALAEAKAYCIKVCKELGAELPQSCK